MKRQWIYVCMLLILAGVLIWSGIHPLNKGLWFYEAGLGIVLIIILLATYRSFPLSTFAYTIVFIASIIMFIGGHYSYARMPIFNYLKETFHLSRNHFDRFGHFFFGLVTTTLLRELLIRTRKIQRKNLFPLFLIGSSLTISATYELVEFLVGYIFSRDIKEFLGLQGDIFDTHWDMIMAILGATTLVFFSKWHDRQIQSVKAQTKL